MTVYCYRSLFLLLSIALYDIGNGCVNTPWTSICKARCGWNDHRAVKLFDCNQTTLLSGSYSGGRGDVQIRFWDSGITKVSRRAFSGYTVGVLELKYSFVTFEPDAFADVTVNRLFISYNSKLTSLPSGVFRGVKGLKRLYLVVNKLRSLPADIFRGLTGLKWLYLCNNNLQSLPADIFTGLEDLEYLHVHGNAISCFAPDLLQPLHSLEELEMSQTVNIEGLCPQTFKGLGPRVMDYEIKLDKCIVQCSNGVGGLKVINPNKTCYCYTYQGCLTCTGNPDEYVTTANTMIETKTTNTVTAQSRVTVTKVSSETMSVTKTKSGTTVTEQSPVTVTEGTSETVTEIRTQNKVPRPLQVITSVTYITSGDPVTSHTKDGPGRSLHKLLTLVLSSFSVMFAIIVIIIGIVRFKRKSDVEEGSVILSSELDSCDIY